MKSNLSVAEDNIVVLSLFFVLIIIVLTCCGWMFFRRELRTAQDLQREYTKLAQQTLDIRQELTLHAESLGTFVDTRQKFLDAIQGQTVLLKHHTDQVHALHRTVRSMMQSLGNPVEYQFKLSEDLRHHLEHHQ